MRRGRLGIHGSREGLLRLLLLGVACWGVISVGSCVLHRDEPMEPARDDLLPGVVVIPRKHWKAAPATSTPERMSSPSRITLHHIGEQIVGDFDRKSTARLIRSIQKFHQGDRGWSDIGYHYVVDRGGRIWEGRPVCQVGAHAGSSATNQGNIGILLLGNFNRQVPSGSQMQGLLSLLDALCRWGGISRQSIHGHDEVRQNAGLAHTDCPGTYLSKWLKGYRRT